MAQEDESGQEKTHEPTEHKLQQLREQGQVPHSQEVGSLLTYVAFAALVLGFGEALTRRMFDLFVAIMSKSGNIAAPEGGQGLASAVWTFLGSLAIVLLPAIAVFLGAALLPSLIQNTVVLAPERIRPKPSKISPKQGFKKIFGAKNLVEFAKAMVVMSVIAATVGGVLWGYMPWAPTLARSPFTASTDLIGEALAYLLLAMIFITAIIAVLDVIFQRIEHRRQARMSHKELQDERKQTEGDPEAKKRLQEKRQERAQSRMMQDVPDAEVVIANPTHFAVALVYRRGHDIAPRCVAKGTDELALRIRRVAAENDVPVVENPELAQGLYRTMEIGQAIPENFYRAVAVVLNQVGAIDKKTKNGG